MGKRASTGYSFIVGVDKPAGMTSHDVVSACRRIYRERRIGHTGTLDPDATGALLVCVGPAARLDQYLTGHDKVYEFSIVFGAATDTDDASGTVVHRADVPLAARNPRFARETLEAMCGTQLQVPPAYSAIKVNGRKAYEDARAGVVLNLAPREVTVYEAELLAIEDDSNDVSWNVRAHVSAGTYVRSLARDIGMKLGTYAHVGDLRRVRVGVMDVRDCVTLESLASNPFAYILDPVPLLGMRVVLAAGKVAARVLSGNAVVADEQVSVMKLHHARDAFSLDDCARGFVPSCEPLHDGEHIAFVVDNTLKAIYVYQAEGNLLKSCCVFATGVQRGADM